MTDNFQNGVTRTLPSSQRQYQLVLTRQKKPPLDAEWNLSQQLRDQALTDLIRSNTHSGFFTDPTRTDIDFEFNPDWSNYFLFGPTTGNTEPVIWACVNGLTIPVAGTFASTVGDLRNYIKLYPPPSSDSRYDFVFLEVWRTVIGANPSTANKPSADKVWKFGNVEFGNTNVDDDIRDPAQAQETTRRVQIQYRLRVFGQGSGAGSSVALDVYPDGLDDPNIYAQGTASSPVSPYAFTNMRDELGDPGLWRAGDGNITNGLGTVDGYTYAIPVAAIRRRNSSGYTAVNSAGNPNHMGAVNRNLSAISLSSPRQGAKAFSPATLYTNITASATGTIQITGLTNSFLSELTSGFIVIDNEVMQYTAINTNVNPATITVSSRGRAGTVAAPHYANTEIQLYNVRPDGLYSDQITREDVIDLRKAITLGDWDYQRLLTHNLSQLLQGKLTTTSKKAGESSSMGIYVTDVSYMHADGSVASPSQTAAVDGPDGIRTIFSDAATIQTDVTVLCNNNTPIDANKFTTTTFDQDISWEVGADFKPSGFVNNSVTGLFRNGSMIFLYLGGDDGSQGARATFRSSSSYKNVRFVSPYEYWKNNKKLASDGKQNPVTLRFLDQKALHPAPQGASDALFPGPLYPLPALSFEKPFIFLGGLVQPQMEQSGINANTEISNGPNGPEIELSAFFDFDTPGTFFSSSGDLEDPDDVAIKLIQNKRTLFDMLTSNGQDRSGSSSELYITLYGDPTNVLNNGAFQVIGAGTVGYTTKSASTATSIVVRALSQGFTTFTLNPSATLNLQFRSMYTNAEDGEGYNDGPTAASAVVVLTDIQGVEGGVSNPWNTNVVIGNTIPATISSPLAINLTLQYNPGSSATVRVPSDIYKISSRGASAIYLRQPLSALDTSISAQAGVPSGETAYPPTSLQFWNRLPSKGLTESSTPKHDAFGGLAVGTSEQDRDAEVFVDLGSKTVLLRPYQLKNMTIQGLDVVTSATSLVGTVTYPSTVVKDGAGIFTTGTAPATGPSMGYAIPPEYMPRFGRQDIPYYTDISSPTGSGNFLEGINHLFADSTDPTSSVFNIIGGRNNTSGGNQVTSMFFQTGSTSGVSYASYGTIAGPATPAYQARLTTDISSLTPVGKRLLNRLSKIISSDISGSLKGIQLPPYLGLARIYGVYERADFIAKGGQTYLADRVTKVADPPKNLLRKTSKQTVYIFQDGAEDLTTELGDHTYIIPENALDLSLAPSYVPGVTDQLEDFEFVVECCIFGFSKDWINENNYVLARRRNGESTVIIDADEPFLEDVRMVLPSAAVLNNQFYVLQNRLVYQGDPYMTRAGETRTISDYQYRYGQISQANAIELAESIQQFDSNGDSLIETPNLRSFEVLSSVDFFTTLGTGKVGGNTFPGTVTDIGHVQNDLLNSTRVPESITNFGYLTETRTFTEGQRDNRSRGYAVVSFDPSVTPIELYGAPAVQVEVKLGSTVVSFTAVNGGIPTSVQFDVSGSVTTTAINLAAKVNAHPLLKDQVVYCKAVANRVEFYAVPVGTEGEQVRVSVLNIHTDGDVEVIGQNNADFRPSRNRTSSLLYGGRDLKVNAGNGYSQVFLGGASDRLPLGILANDFDFADEDILSDGQSSFKITSQGITVSNRPFPLTEAGKEYERFYGEPGQLLAMCDGGVLQYAPYNEVTSPSGTRRYRVFRGGSIFVLSGDNPGSPVDWSGGSLPPGLLPVLKAGVLAGKAILVRNFKETAFTSNNTVSHGDEIQMIILTYSVFGNGRSQEEGVSLDAVICPTGFGEGYAAAERYRIEGLPQYRKSSTDHPDPSDVKLTPFTKE